MTVWPFGVKIKKSKKKLFLVDGDSCISDTWVYVDVLGSSEVYVFHNVTENQQKPKVIRNLPEVNYIPVEGFKGSKETVDKLIGIMAQKAISEGYCEINIVSKDCDFPDIARLLAGVNPESNTIINVIIPEVKVLAKNVSYQNTIHGNVSVRVYRIKRRRNYEFNGQAKESLDN